MKAGIKLAQGVGINDADYITQPTVNGKRTCCHFYSTWRNLITRCYSQKALKKCPTYFDCVVCDDWLYFSKFKAWMETQDWQGKQLDKDLLYPGNKIYSPETCVFVDHVTNTFLIDSGSIRGDLPIGVVYSASKRKYQTQCNSKLIGKSRHVGYFDNPEDAHKAWEIRKAEVAVYVASIQKDERVAKAILERFL